MFEQGLGVEHNMGKAVELYQQTHRTGIAEGARAAARVRSAGHFGRASEPREVKQTGEPLLSYSVVSVLARRLSADS